ncbi:MAG: adenine phosphoribosyltransferase [Jatrophihabitans sp.]
MTSPELPLAELIASRLREVPDFPKPGVVFKDITLLLADGAAFGRVTAALAEHAGELGVELVAGVEARGFIMAAALADRLGCGLVPVRKAGKLPPPTVHASYDLEYGSGEIEVPVGVLDGHRILLVDDVLATGGTLAAAADLIEEAGGEIVGLAVLLELGFLNGRDRLGTRALTALLRI